MASKKLWALYGRTSSLPPGRVSGITATCVLERAQYILNRDLSLDAFCVDKHPFVGIELECETSESDSLEPSPMYLEILDILKMFGKIASEGSLRGGFELQCAPMSIHIAKQIFPIVNELIALCGNTFQFTWRTSTHVHLNCLDLTGEELQVMLALVILLEPALFEFVGEERANSVFCRPVGEAISKYELSALLGAPFSPSLLENYGGDWKKYSSINLKSFFKFKTCEFRLFPGFSNLEKMLQWLDIINAIYTTAKSPEFTMAQLWKSCQYLKTTSNFSGYLATVFPPKISSLLLNTPSQNLLKGATFLRTLPLSPDGKHIPLELGPKLKFLDNFETNNNPMDFNLPKGVF